MEPHSFIFAQVEPCEISPVGWFRVHPMSPIPDHYWQRVLLLVKPDFSITYTTLDGTTHTQKLLLFLFNVEFQLKTFDGREYQISTGSYRFISKLHLNDNFVPNAHQLYKMYMKDATAEKKHSSITYYMLMKEKEMLAATCQVKKVVIPDRAKQYAICGKAPMLALTNGANNSGGNGDAIMRQLVPKLPDDSIHHQLPPGIAQKPGNGNRHQKGKNGRQSRNNGGSRPSSSISMHSERGNGSANVSLNSQNGSNNRAQTQDGAQSSQQAHHQQKSNGNSKKKNQRAKSQQGHHQDKHRGNRPQTSASIHNESIGGPREDSKPLSSKQSQIKSNGKSKEGAEPKNNEDQQLVMIQAAPVDHKKPDDDLQVAEPIEEPVFECSVIYIPIECLLGLNLPNKEAAVEFIHKRAEALESKNGWGTIVYYEWKDALRENGFAFDACIYWMGLRKLEPMFAVENELSILSKLRKNDMDFTKVFTFDDEFRVFSECRLNSELIDADRDSYALAIDYVQLEARPSMIYMPIEVLLGWDMPIKRRLLRDATNNVNSMQEQYGVRCEAYAKLTQAMKDDGFAYDACIYWLFEQNGARLENELWILQQLMNNDMDFTKVFTFDDEFRPNSKFRPNSELIEPGRHAYALESEYVPSEDDEETPCEEPRYYIPIELLLEQAHTNKRDAMIFLRSRANKLHFYDAVSYDVCEEWFEALKKDGLAFDACVYWKIQRRDPSQWKVRHDLQLLHQLKLHNLDFTKVFTFDDNYRWMAGDLPYLPNSEFFDRERASYALIKKYDPSVDADVDIEEIEMDFDL